MWSSFKPFTYTLSAGARCCPQLKDYKFTKDYLPNKRQKKIQSQVYLTPKRRAFFFFSLPFSPFVLFKMSTVKMNSGVLWKQHAILDVKRLKWFRVLKIALTLTLRNKNVIRYQSILTRGKSHL